MESGTVSDMCQKLFKIYISKCNVLIFGILFYFDIDILCFFRFKTFHPTVNCTQCAVWYIVPSSLVVKKKSLLSSDHPNSFSTCNPSILLIVYLYLINSIQPYKLPTFILSNLIHFLPATEPSIHTGIHCLYSSSTG